MNKALLRRNTIISAAKILWIAGEFESEIYSQTVGDEVEYERLLSEKLAELGWSAPSRGSHDASVSGITDECWEKIQSMKGLYFQGLQSCYIVLVAALRQEELLPERELKPLKAFRRLILGLVVFLSAERHRIPSRFNQEKLMRLEGEMVQIFKMMLKKAEDGTLSFSEDVTSLLQAAVRDSPGVQFVGGHVSTSMKHDCKMLSDVRPREAVVACPGKRKMSSLAGRIMKRVCASSTGGGLVSTCLAEDETNFQEHL